MPTPRRGKPTALGCYIFAGGFTVGVSKHFNVLAHLEGNTYGVATSKLNFPNLTHYVGFDKWPAVKADFVYGNPPCAAWSQNNGRDSSAWKSDNRVSCVRELFTLIQATGCRVWVWESVCQAPVKGKEFVDQLIERAAGMGYSATQVFHDAQYLGVPQTRKRWFLVLHNVEFKPVEPDWKVMSAVECLKQVKPTGDRAYDVKGMKDVIEPRLKDIPPGARMRAVWSKVGGKTGRKGLKVTVPVGLGHVRLRREGPAPATVGYAMAHPTQHRFLHVNEVAALAGFPPGYQFTGGPMGAQQLDLIARGVCPPVGEWIARAAAKAIKANVTIKKPAMTVYDFRKPPTEVA